MDLTTTAAKQEGINTLRQFESHETTSERTGIIAPALSTVQPELKTSTHPADYDYYGNNEVEENEHKN